MATLIEASFKLMQLHREIHGTGAAETLFGGVIGDTIYTGAGNDVVYAGSGNDTIEATSFGSGSVWAAWGNDTVHAGSGDDHINYGQTTSDVTLFGDRGNDWITAGQGNDHIYGGDGNDWIYGYAGNDTIYGDNALGVAGNDTIYGGEGRDTINGGGGDDIIWGGDGVDYLTGGRGADTFKFDANDSGLHWKDADVITDFKPSFDRGFPGDVIHFDGMEKGTSSNFYHLTIDTSIYHSESAAYEHALENANSFMKLSNTHPKYEFVSDGHNGWLFADTDGDHRVDTGIELKGVTDMHAWNIV